MPCPRMLLPFLRPKPEFKARKNDEHTSTAGINWSPTKLSRVPRFYYLGPTRRFVNDDPNDVVRRLTEAILSFSIHADYCDETATAMLKTLQGVEMKIRLWQPSQQQLGGVIVEIIRRKGDVLAFRRYSHRILDAAAGGINRSLDKISDPFQTTMYNPNAPLENRSLNIISDPFEKVMHQLNTILESRYNKVDSLFQNRADSLFNLNCFGTKGWGLACTQSTYQIPIDTTNMYMKVIPECRGLECFIDDSGRMRMTLQMDTVDSVGNRPITRRTTDDKLVSRVFKTTNAAKSCANEAKDAKHGKDGRGRLKITGRTKEIFKTSKGKYAAPAPIENELISNQHVELACVGGKSQPQPFPDSDVRNGSNSVSAKHMKSIEGHVSDLRAKAGAGETSIGDAINLAIHEEMLRDPSATITAEDLQAGSSYDILERSQHAYGQNRPAEGIIDFGKFIGKRQHGNNISHVPSHTYSNNDPFSVLAQPQQAQPSQVKIEMGRLLREHLLRREVEDGEIEVLNPQPLELRGTGWKYPEPVSIPCASSTLNKISDYISKYGNCLESSVKKKLSRCCKAANGKLIATLATMTVGNAVMELLKLPLVRGAETQLRVSSNETATGGDTDGNPVSSIYAIVEVLLFLLSIVATMGLVTFFYKTALMTFEFLRNLDHDRVDMELGLGLLRLKASARGRAQEEVGEDDKGEFEEESQEETVGESEEEDLDEVLDQALLSENTMN